MGALRNPRDEKFASKYAALRLEGAPASAAALTAYHAAGFVGTAANARRKSNRVEVRRRIGEIQARAAEFAEIDVQFVMVELKRIAAANLVDFLDADGRIDASKLPGLPRHLTAALQGLKYDAKGRPEIKLHDKVAALDKLGKALGLWRDGANVSVEVSLAQLIEASFARPGDNAQIVESPQAIENESESA